MQVRLARDLADMPERSQQHALERMREVGGQIGGWFKRG